MPHTFFADVSPWWLVTFVMACITTAVYIWMTSTPNFGPKDTDMSRYWITTAGIYCLYFALLWPKWFIVALMLAVVTVILVIVVVIGIMIYAWVRMDQAGLI